MENKPVSQNINREVEIYQAEVPPRHNQLLRLIALGFNQRQCAEKLNMSESRVSIIVNTPLAKSIVKKYQNEINDGVAQAQMILMENSPEAALVLVDRMKDGENKRLQKESAVEILKGTRVIAGDKMEGQTINITINDTKMDLIMKTFQELNVGRK